MSNPLPPAVLLDGPPADFANDGVGDLHWPLLTGRLTATHLTDLAALRDVGYADGLCLELKAAVSERASVPRAGKEIAERFLPFSSFPSHAATMVQLHLVGRLAIEEGPSDPEETRRLLRRVRGGDGRALPRLHQLLVEDGVTESQL